MFPKRGLAALAITTVALVLLLSFRTPDQALPGSAGNVAIVEPGTQATAAPGATTAPGTDSAATPSPATATVEVTIDGPVVSTRWGPVQVSIVVADGRLQDVVALQLPTGHQSGEISDRSEPILREEALQAQSADIDIVSGATYTSEAYAQSLQAALDEAGLG
jgi:uncharacterized protein with FMN-binding domain